MGSYMWLTDELVLQKAYVDYTGATGKKQQMLFIKFCFEFSSQERTTWLSPGDEELVLHYSLTSCILKKN
jgi:hypothetical protein